MVTKFQHINYLAKNTLEVKGAVEDVVLVVNKEVTVVVIEEVVVTILDVAKYKY